MQKLSHPNRKKMRLENYDYSQNGYYFVTICTKARECFFGEIRDGKMILNEYGKIAEKEILQTEKIRKEIKIDIFVIMPNHLHLVVVIDNGFYDVEKQLQGNGKEQLEGFVDGNHGRERLQSFPTRTYYFDERGAIGLQGNNLSSIIRSIKSSITREIRKKYEDFQFGWQKSFYDVIIRNEDQLLKTREYIENNPLKWELDKDNPENIEKEKP
ncbi:transposase [Candidatus Gracilibacteria bacterium]|nr:transposase [Candidatus Gracilibacteria bacterium]